MRKATWWEEFQRGARRPEQQHIVDLEAEVERLRAAGRGLVEHLADTGEKDCPIVDEYADVFIRPKDGLGDARRER